MKDSPSQFSSANNFSQTKKKNNKLHYTFLDGIEVTWNEDKIRMGPRGTCLDNTIFAYSLATNTHTTHLETTILM